MKIFPLVALCMTASPSLAVQLESLGSVPNGFYSPSLISQDGEVIAGYSDGPQTGTKVGVWTRLSGLTVLDAGTTERFAPFGMSADGTIITGDQLDIGPDLVRRPMLWDLAAGTRTDLGILPGFASSGVVSISADGSTVVGRCSQLTGFVTQAFRWTAATGLQSLAPSAIFHPALRGVNADGSIVVGSTVPAHDSFDARAAIWSLSGGLSTIPGLPNARSYITSVSDDGQQLVGFVEDPAFPSGVFYYEPGLGAFPVNLGGGVANSGSSILISADGSTVVAQVLGRVVKWSLGGGPEVLDLSGYTAPSSISADGSTIAGYTAPAFGSSDLRAFRWASSGQVFVLDSIESGLQAVGMAISRDGSAICGRSAAGAASQLQGARWSSDGAIGTSYCGPAVPNSLGVASSLLLSGSNVIDRGDLLLRATGIPPLSFGIFLVAQSSASATGVPGSQGNLCLGSTMGRFVGPGQVQQASIFGDMSLTVDPAMLPGPLGTFSATPGESLYFQVWYRDANPGATSNFSSGATAVFF